MNPATFITANVHGGNDERERLAQRLEDTGALAIGCQEAWWLSNLMGYRRYTGDAAQWGRAATECAVFLRNDVRYLGHFAYFVKPDLGAPITPARFLVGVRFIHRGFRGVLLDTHLDAALQDPDTGELVDARRVPLAAKQMQQLLAETKHQRAAGFRPFWTGGFNYFPREGQTHRWRWSPSIVAGRAHLRAYRHGLDYVAVPKRLADHHAETLILPGSPHAGLAITVNLPQGRGA